jgi:hypothetical protein
VWPQTIDAAKTFQLQQISFLPADVSSSAFNREVKWNNERQEELILSKEELPLLKTVIDQLIENYKTDFTNHFIAEVPDKLMKIYEYYAALHGFNAFPKKKCNAPWVSAVVEADGSVRPCFFHESIGNIRQNNLNELLNSEAAIAFRRNLNVEQDVICMKCVCYLNLPATVDPCVL